MSGGGDDDDFWLTVHSACEARMHERAHLQKENACEWWVVGHARVPVRDSASVAGKAVDVLRLGALVRAAHVESVDGARWLRLHAEELRHIPMLKAAEAWLLVDGAAFGLGQLLRPAPPEIDWAPLASLPPAERAAPASLLLEQRRPEVEQRARELAREASQRMAGEPVQACPLEHEPSPRSS